jgi:ABC-type glycerol-3-phosphate transport system permease component
MANFLKAHAGTRANRSTIGDIVLILLLALLAVIFAFPLYFTIINSLKPPDEFFLFPPRFYVIKPTAQNYQNLFRLMSTSWVPFSRYIFNTVMVTVIGTVGHCIITSLAAFPCCKYVFPGSQSVGKLTRMALMFNSTVLSLAVYIIMNALGWIDTYWAMIIPAIAGPLGFFLMQSFMVVVPDALLEAAIIDGAGFQTLFWRIVMPLVKSGWLTLAIFKIQELWNLTSSSFIYSETLKTLPYAISQVTSGGIARQGAAAAGSVIMLIVPLIFFIIIQSNVLETMATSGMKD